MIDDCTKYNLDERPSFQELLKPFLQWEEDEEIEWEKKLNIQKKLG